MSEQFKAGDEVYYPSLDFNIHVLALNEKNGLYCLVIDNGDGISINGKYLHTDKLPSIFHATPENKALLEALYKCDFESPKLKGSDLTRKLLAEGKHVLCYVSDLSDHSAIAKKKFSLLVHALCGDFSFEDADGVAWTYAVPCNDYANLADGVLTLKSENEK